MLRTSTSREITASLEIKPKIKNKKRKKITRKKRMIYKYQKETRKSKSHLIKPSKMKFELTTAELLNEITKKSLSIPTAF